MAQYNLDTLDINTDTGSTLAADLNNWVPAVLSNHSGSTAPTYATPGMLWADTTAANIVYKVRGASAFRPAFQLDDTNGVARVALDADGDSYLVSDTDDVIRAVISGSEVARINSAGLRLNGDTLTGIADVDDIESGTAGQILDAAVLGEVVLASAYAETASDLSTTTQIPTDATIPQSTEGSEALTVTLTRVSDASRIRLQGHFLAGASSIPSGAGFGMTIAVFQDSSADAIFATTATIGGTDFIESIPFDFEIANAATGSTTFKVRFGINTSGTAYINRRSTISDLFSTVGKSTLRVTEFVRS